MTIFDDNTVLSDFVCGDNTIYIRKYTMIQMTTKNSIIIITDLVILLPPVLTHAVQLTQLQNEPILRTKFKVFVLTKLLFLLKKSSF